MMDRGKGKCSRESKVKGDREETRDERPGKMKGKKKKRRRKEDSKVTAGEKPVPSTS